MAFTAPQRLNLADWLLDARLREGRGARVALHLDHRSLTYEEVSALANRAGGALRRLGVRQEERVVIALPDGPDFVATLFGALKIGAVVVMVNPSLGEAEIAGILEYSRARLVVVAAAALESFLEAAGRAGDRTRVVIAGRPLGEHPSLEEEGERAGEALETVATHCDDPALWLFSGGTTGRPKAVVQTHRSFANTTARYALETLGWGEDDVTLSVPKLYFGYATGSNLFFPFAAGASAVLFPEHPTAEVLFEKIRRHRPTILVNVPTMINQMVSHPAAAEQDLSCLRFATSAGEALPAPLYHRWRETFGVELLDGLGTAEMWHIFLTNRPGEVRPGTLGRVVSGFEIRVCDEEGREVPDGEPGRLWVRGDSRALGYWQDLPRTAEAFRGEWFVGGDLVSRDADGYVTYCGRADDVLKVSGKWLAPQEVESCLMRHPEVAECAVVGVETEDGLTKPHAFVVRKVDSTAAQVTDAGELEQALKDFVLERLAPYKHPRRIHFVEAMPRTHLGKIDRGALKNLTGAG